LGRHRLARDKQMSRQVDQEVAMMIGTGLILAERGIVVH
jgi:hypothetical protein